MKITNKIKVRGYVRIFNVTKNKVELELKNLVVDSGLALIADRLNNDGQNAIDYFAIGDDSTAVDPSDTALYNETYRAAITTKSTPGAELQTTTIISGVDALGTWGELALFNASVTGTMLSRLTISYTHSAGDTIQVDWNIIFSVV